MVAFLTDAGLVIVTRRERRCEVGVLECFFNPCARLDTRLLLVLDPGLDLGVVFSLECKCNVTPLLPGDYFHFKGGMVGRF